MKKTVTLFDNEYDELLNKIKKLEDFIESIHKTNKKIVVIDKLQADTINNFFGIRNFPKIITENEQDVIQELKESYEKTYEFMKEKNMQINKMYEEYKKEKEERREIRLPKFLGLQLFRLKRL